LKHVNVQTFQLGLIGYPLGHSLSPKIHREAMDAYGLRGEYSLFPIQPHDIQGLKDLLTRVRSGEIHGLNVTIPHKQKVIPLLDELTPTARAIGAVNTIFLQEGKLIGDNTDVPGFLADLEIFLTTETPRPDRQSRGGRRHRDNEKVLVLGAGGSARAVVYALAQDGWKVTIAARRIEQARELIARLPNPESRLSSIEFTAFQSLLPTLSLVVNTTPLGMSPNIDTSPWPADLPFPLDAAVYDLVYNPRETKLIRDARAAGLPATTGLGMLIEQAALSFEIWTGCNPPRETLWNTLTTEY